MMNDIMFDFPNKGIGSERVHGETHDVIDAFTFRITTMVCIMHYIKPNGSDAQTKNTTNKKR